MAEDRAQALAAGMNDYITKPISLDALQGAISRWAQSRVSAGADRNTGSS